MSTVIHRRVEECRAGRDPQTVCRVTSGGVCSATRSFVRGYSLLLPDPVVADLNQARRRQAHGVLARHVLVGDALLALTDAVRINYEILGNVDPALHAHVIPRYFLRARGAAPRVRLVLRLGGRRRASTRRATGRSSRRCAASRAPRRGGLTSVRSRPRCRLPTAGATGSRIFGLSEPCERRDG